MKAGWQGVLAIEKNPDAFKTLSHNLVEENKKNAEKLNFNWPNWLDRGPYDLSEFIEQHSNELEGLRGVVGLVCGGPPCQGFSYAGKRLGMDPRNELFRLHLNVVELVQPEIVLMENVQGINTAFRAKDNDLGVKCETPNGNYAIQIKETLNQLGYTVQQELIRASDFGVPQVRPRFFTLGIRKDLFHSDCVPNFFEILREIREDFLESKHLPVFRPVTVAEAISDLRTTFSKITECIDPESPPGYKEIIYRGPVSSYQLLMHEGSNGQVPNSLRLVNHRPETKTRFESILRTCRKGVHLSDADRARLGIGKRSITPLAPNLPSHTLTTIPDDFLHYAEPRVHTVREHARLQSFPDWFDFRGKFTTGGKLRAMDCPRYTQVGNAVPPLLAEAIGIAAKKLLLSSKCRVF